MDTYRRAAKEFTERVRGLSVADLARSTPCQGWSVADILRHVIQDHEESLGAAPTEVGGDGLVARWHSSTRAYAAAIASDRAHLSGAAELTALDLALHGWDLAVATGVDATLSAATLAFVQEFADRTGDRIYADGAFAQLDLDPAGLSQQERLLGHFGRHPATWRRVDDQDPAERAALASLRSGSAAGRRRDAGLPPLTAGEEQEFVSRLHTWLDDEQGHRRHYLADLGGQSVGMAGMLVYRRMPKPGASPGVWCYVGNLFVATEHRNAGVGHRLLTAMLDDARAMGAARVVLSPSARSVPWYRRNGFGDADGLLVNPLV
ncbi:hypothetical protein BH24ACT8_BH24ACT8_20440 [soil metagenome]